MSNPTDYSFNAYYVAQGVNAPGEQIKPADQSGDGRYTVYVAGSAQNAPSRMRPSAVPQRPELQPAFKNVEKSKEKFNQAVKEAAAADAHARAVAVKEAEITLEFIRKHTEHVNIPRSDEALAAQEHGPPQEDLQNEAAAQKAAEAAHDATIRQLLSEQPDNVKILEMSKIDPHLVYASLPQEEEDAPSELTRYMNFAANLMTSPVNQATPKAVPTEGEEQQPTIEETSELTDYVAKCAHFGEVDDRAKLYPHLNPQSKQ